MEEMYNPPTFLTRQILDEILSEFKWPAPYTIGDDSCTADGVDVRFPKCTLFFVEGFESEMSLYFSHVETKTEYALTLFTAIHYVLDPQAKQDPNFQEPKLTGYFEPAASLEKVKNGLRDICLLLQTYLLPCIEGDFSWVEKYKKLQEKK
jgi:hypothetical protein